VGVNIEETPMPKKSADADTEDVALTVRIPPDVHRALRLAAAEQDRSLNLQIVEVLREWWEKKPDRSRYETFLKGGKGRG
jgi:hypothetical protein